MVLQRLHLLLIDLSLLELQSCSGFSHQLLIMLYDFPSATFEQRYDLLDILIVFLLGNAADAASEALLYMEVCTRTYLVAQNHI